MNDKLLFICLEKQNLIHSLKLLELYKENYPNLYVLCDKSDSKYIKIKGLNLILIDVKALLSQIADCELDLYKRTIVLNSFLSKLIKQFFDLIINLDYSNELSAVISSYLNSKNVWGRSYDEYGFPCYDNNKFKYLIYSKKNNNLFFYNELIFKALNQDIIKYELSNFDEIDSSKFVIVLNENSKLNTKLEDNNFIYYKDIKNIDDFIKSYEFIITENEYLANFSSINKVQTIFLSNSYIDFYNVYPYYGSTRYVLTNEINDKIIKEILSNSINFFFPIYDKFSYIYLVPKNKIKLEKNVFDFFVLKAVWKYVLNREITVGDKRKFISIGEKYIDRVMDISVEIELLNSILFNFFDSSSVKNRISLLNEKLSFINTIKDLSFQGIKLSKDYLSSVSSPKCELEEIKQKNRNLLNIDNKIYEEINLDFTLNDFINYFKNERDNYHLRNLFPMVKNIVFSYEDLYTKICFYEEIVKGVNNAR